MSNAEGVPPSGGQAGNATETPGNASVAYRSILVPLDGSERAEAALPHAVALAQQFGARVLLYCAVQSPLVVSPGMAGPTPGVMVPPTPTVDPVQLTREAHDAVVEYLDGRVGELQSLDVAATAFVGANGDIADQILDLAGQEGADLIVMTTHGRTGLGRLLFGSVAESCLRRARIPVLLIRTAESE